MAMAMNLGTSGKPGAEINVTPLIDVLLVLLIIFMVLTPLHNVGEKALIPQPPEKDLPEIVQPSVIVLQMTPDPAGLVVLRINGQETNWQDLRPKLAAIYKQRADKALFLRADGQLDWEPVAQAIDIAHTAGVVNVGLITAKIEEARK
jgi:biopolymer transport protein ExbD